MVARDLTFDTGSGTTSITENLHDYILDLSETDNGTGHGGLDYWSSAGDLRTGRNDRQNWQMYYFVKAINDTTRSLRTRGSILNKTRVVSKKGNKRSEHE